MAGLWTSPVRRGTDGPDRGTPLGGWPGFGRFLADRWASQVFPEAVGLWTAASDSRDQPLVLRVRAAGAADPFRH